MDEVPTVDDLYEELLPIIEQYVSWYRKWDILRVAKGYPYPFKPIEEIASERLEEETKPNV